jgi:two-component system response regulator FixJ
MATTVYVIDPDLDERTRIQLALAPSGEGVVFLEDASALFANPLGSEGACLVVSAEPDAAATLKLVRDLRGRGATLPVIVLGPHSAFRTAVEIARLEATDFLERPISAWQLRTTVSKVCKYRP